jgi:hypothetical protein
LLAVVVVVRLTLVVVVLVVIAIPFQANYLVETLLLKPR